MRQIFLAFLSFGWAVAVAGWGRADDPPASCHQVLDKAIKAMGGEAKLAALKVAIVKTKSNYFFLAPIDISVNEEWYVDSDRYRFYLDGLAKDVPFRQSVVITGDRGWSADDETGKTNDLPPIVFTGVKAGIYAFRLVHRLPALKKKPFELTGLGAVKVGDRKAVGLKVVQKGFPEVRLYFDQETGLPAKSEVRIKEFDFQAGAGVAYAFSFAEYKDFDGLRHFSKVALQRDDKPFYESTVVDISPLDRLNRILFEK